MIPKVVIVGRPNVGKSSLLNMLAGRTISIVDPTPGVTRDRISTLVELRPPLPDSAEAVRRLPPPRVIELIDTGGHGMHDSQQLESEVERQILLALDEADLILFVIDAQAGLDALDMDVARMLRERHAGAVDRTSGPSSGSGDKNRGRQPVILLANKVDDFRREPLAAEASRLGFGPALPVSATTGYHKDALIEMLYGSFDWSVLDAPTQLPDSGPLLAIVGKRNAGKSTLINALASLSAGVKGRDRVIVSEVEGTTRDAVDVRFEYRGQVFTAIDTAGVRKRKAVKADLDFYSLHRALRSIRRADVALLLVDATVPVSQVDKQLSTELQRHFKPTVVVVNKWDLVTDPAKQKSFIKYMDDVLIGLRYAPMAFVSGKTGEGVREVVSTALSLTEQAARRVPTAELNEAVRKVTSARPPMSRQGKAPKIYYATQLDVRPPTIALFVNDPLTFTPTYQRYLLSALRELLPYAEVPIKLVIRGKERGSAGEADEAQGSGSRPARPARRGKSSRTPRVPSAGPRARRPGGGRHGPSGRGRGRR